MLIYNPSTKKKEIFKSMSEMSVQMYVCGPTLYSDIHIGNARPIIFFDILKRVLIDQGYQVNYISNITDIDDKIINQAKKENITEKALVDKNIEKYIALTKELNIYQNVQIELVTDYIQEIIDYIDNLVKLEFAYVKNGDVYFSVDKIENYGHLSNYQVTDYNLNQEINNNLKKNNQDFTLWKATTDGISWNSKWSKGRPGWHSECAVLINQKFGKKIDIHGGGVDLKFPHHENENAQSQACNQIDLANYWIHNGFVNIDNQKMSKSIGNVVKPEQIIKQYGVNFLKLLMLQTNYRQPINITDQFYELTNKLNMKLNNYYLKYDLTNLEVDSSCQEVQELQNIMADDLNTANLIDRFFQIMSSKNNQVTVKQQSLKYFTNVLGLNIYYEQIPEEIIKLSDQRSQLKKNKKYQEADEIRQKIEILGYQIFDTREGVTCKKK